MVIIYCKFGKSSQSFRLLAQWLVHYMQWWKVTRTSPGWLPGYFFCSQAIFGGGSQAPRSSQAPRASVAPNYRLPGSSQLVAQIPGSQELPAGNQNHCFFMLAFIFSVVCRY